MSAMDDDIALALMTVWCNPEGSGISDAALLRAELRAAGYAVVPVQPTKEMILAGDTAQDDCTDMDRDSYGTSWRVRSDAYLDIYRAMIAAVDTPGGDGVE